MPGSNTLTSEYALEQIPILLSNVKRLSRGKKELDPKSESEILWCMLGILYLKNILNTMDEGELDNNLRVKFVKLQKLYVSIASDSKNILLQAHLLKNTTSETLTTNGTLKLIADMIMREYVGSPASSKESTPIVKPVTSVAKAKTEPFIVLINRLESRISVLTWTRILYRLLRMTDSAAVVHDKIILLADLQSNLKDELKVDNRKEISEVVNEWKSKQSTFNRNMTHGQLLMTHRYNSWMGTPKDKRTGATRTQELINDALGSNDAGSSDAVSNNRNSGMGPVRPKK